MGFKVVNKPCNECLFSTAKIVTDERRDEVLADCAQADTHFICHKFTIADNSDVCCHGFYSRDPYATNLMRIAHRLDVVEFVTLPEEKST